MMMISQRTPFFLFGIILGCGCHVDTPTANETAYVPPVVHRTTSGAIATANANEAIAAAKVRFERDPSDINRASYVGQLLQRARFAGTYDDFDLVEALTRDGDSPKAKRLRAEVLTRLHRFDEATSLLAPADGLAAVIAAARGDHERATALLSARPSNTVADLTRSAALDVAAGRFDTAEERFRTALDKHRDVSPMFVSAVLFSMGVMWSERAGAPERGRVLYEMAVERLPSFVTANVHLAEIEFASGQHERAIDRLLRLVDDTADPEPAGRLAQWLGEIGDPRADAFRRRADEGYTALLAHHRLAFADHAAEFYLAAGEDAARAFALAGDNLANRKTERAYALAIRAAQAAGASEVACRWIDEALARPSSGVELHDLVPCPL